MVHPLLPGEFFAPSPAKCTDITDFASQLQVHIRKLRTIPASWHATPSMFIFKEMATTSQVFLWLSALQVPYFSPYMVLHRGDKTYTIEVHGAVTKVPTDCLKLAYVLHFNIKSASPPAIPSSTMTQSGRRICFPDYLGIAAISTWGWHSGHH